MQKLKKLYIPGLMVLLLGMAVHGAVAAELPAGTVITKANLDRIKGDTFEGKTIASLLTKSLEMQIRDWGLKIRLQRSRPYVIDPRYTAATKRYKGTTKFDPRTRECTGYQAGEPFPNVSMDDPSAGDKLVYNYYYGTVTGKTQHVPHSWLLIDGKTGLERRQDWFWLRFYEKGRLEKGKPVVGDGSIVTKSLLFVTAPYDLRGVGIYQVRYDSPKLEDQWVYVKSVRRTRRLSGGAWVDPVDGLDMLGDDIWVWGARPSWYDKITLLGKRWVLAIANDKLDWVEGAETVEEEFPGIDLQNPPYWNSSTLKGWEPREVYVIEGTPPDYHPYSKRVAYMDVAVPVMYYADCYDKHGDLWKFVNYSMAPHKDVDGNPTIITVYGLYADFKRQHASIHYARVWTDNPKYITKDDVTLGKLRQAGK